MTAFQAITKSTTEHLGAAQFNRPPLPAKRHGFSPPFTPAAHFFVFRDIGAAEDRSFWSEFVFESSCDAPDWFNSLQPADLPEIES
jgi:hypothetical protein